DQDVVVDAVEELFQVHDRHDTAARLDVRLRGKYRVLRTPSRPEAVTMLAEGGIQQGLQHLQQRLLNQPVRYRRDTQLALAAVGLGNHHTAYRPWPVRP